MANIFRVRDDEATQAVLSPRRPWYYVAFGLLVLGLLTRQPILLLVSLFSFLVGIIPNLWFRQALKHLLVRQQVSQHHLFFGEVVTLSVTIENRKRLPLPWLQVDNTITPSLTPLMQQDAQANRLQAIEHETLISTWLLWSYQRVTRRYRLRCHARGFHIFGPLRLRSSDPFGWLERERWLPARETLLVYPLLAPLAELGLPAAFPQGEHVGPRQLLEDPLWFAGNRTYQLGDDPRRIDWKATARVGTLRSKIFESTMERHLLILLDTYAYDSDKKATDKELQELAISVAASLAMWGLDNGYMVGLQTNAAMITATQALSTEVKTDTTPEDGAVSAANATTISSPGNAVDFGRDPAQYQQIMSMLARLVPGANTPIEHIIEYEDRMFPQSATVLLVSVHTTLSTTTIEQLEQRQRHNNTAIGIVLIGEQEHDTHSEHRQQELPDTLDFATYYVGGKEKWHELIHNIDEQAAGFSAVDPQLD